MARAERLVRVGASCREEAICHGAAIGRPRQQEAEVPVVRVLDHLESRRRLRCWAAEAYVPVLESGDASEVAQVVGEEKISQMLIVSLWQTA